MDSGPKPIDGFGSAALLVNNVIGPGITALPHLFQSAGWLPTVLVTCFMCFLSCMSSFFLCHALQKIPGNAGYKGGVEFLSAAQHYFPAPWYQATLGLLMVSMLSLMVASITQSIEIADNVIERLAGKSCGLLLYPSLELVCDKDLPIPDSTIVSLGFVVFFLATVPICFMDLDDSIIVQEVSFVVLLLILAEWTFNFAGHEILPGGVHMFATDQHEVLGVLAFNYCFVTTVPSWLNKKAEHVSEVVSIGWSAVFATAIFLLIGVWGALTVPRPLSNDLLDALSKEPSFLATISVYAFPAVVNLAGIPVLCVVIRDNLIDSQLCGPSVAKVLANVAPWLITVPFYTREGFQTLINWTSLLTLGVINFIVPLMMFVRSLEVVEDKDHFLVSGGGVTTLADPSSQELSLADLRGTFPPGHLEAGAGGAAAAASVVRAGAQWGGAGDTACRATMRRQSSSVKGPWVVVVESVVVVAQPQFPQNLPVGGGWWGL